MKLSICFLVILSLASCKKVDRDDNVKEIVVPLEGYDKYVSTKEILDPDFFEIISLSNDSVSLGLIEDIQFSDSLFYLLNNSRNKIFIFDESGELKTIIDRQGGASEEYSEIESFTINNGMVFILDLNKRKILNYLQDGKFIDSIDISTIWANQLAVIKDEIYAYNDLSDTDSGKFHLFKVSSNKKFDSFLPFSLNPGSRMKKSITDNFVYERESNILYSVVEGKPEALLKFDFGEFNLPPKYLSSDVIELIQSGVIDKYMLGVDEIQKAGDKIILKCDMKGDPALLVYDLSQEEVNYFCRGFKQDMFFGIGLKKYLFDEGYVYDLYYADELCLILDNFIPDNITPEYLRKRDELRASIYPESNPVIFKYKLL